MSFNINSFETNGHLVEALAEDMALRLRDAVAERGAASLAVSGGSTPVSLFKRLANIDLPWQQVWITLVDERWVGDDHPDSNARLVNMHLLQNRAAAANFIPLKTAAESPFGAETEMEAALEPIPKPFDVAVLGMGGDGHTASFFPGADTLSVALDMNNKALCAAVRPLTAPHDRMTLTLKTLLQSKHLVLHIVGESKWQVLQEAIEPGPVDELPVRSVLHQNLSPLTIFYAGQE